MKAGRLLAALMCLVMVLSLMSAAALADDEQELKHRAFFTVDDVTVAQGEVVDINVKITENEGIAAAYVQLSCDQFTIVDIACGD